MTRCFQLFFLSISLVTTDCAALLTTEQQHISQGTSSLQSLSTVNANILQIDRSFQDRSRSSTELPSKKKNSICFCPDAVDDEDSDILEDRRETIFALMGTLWAAGTLPASMLGQPSAAYAVYGSDAQMIFPDVVQGMSDRNTKQCLVESLGNRECLVYQEDEEKLLYKGADTQVLLNRIQLATRALEKEITPLVETKQWIKITGVLTGPMGQLSSTMTLLCKLADRPEEAKQKAQQVKNDLFAMGTATTNKSGEDVLKYQQLAIQDLAVFLISL